MFLLTYAWSNLAIALEALAYQGESGHIAHELHDPAHVSAWANNHDSHDEQLENNAHHHCAHSLVGMAFTMPAAHRSDATTLLIANSPIPHYFEFQRRLLRPPRN
jgi:hypothetical protein